jgi:phosphate transport system protein
MQGHHILKSYDARLDALKQRLERMGEDAASMAADCLTIYLKHDVRAAQAVIRKDLDMDRENEEIRTEVMDLLARMHPVASDLRQILAVERAAVNLERVGDKAKSIVKRCLAFNNGPPALGDDTVELLKGLHRSVVRMLQDALSALSRRQHDLATDVENRDAGADALYDDLFHHIVAQIQTDPSKAAENVHALFVAKSLERIGDHATNIAEEVHFVLRGSSPPATREVSSDHP